MTNQDNHSVDAAVLVVAAGRGQRFGGALPKQYAPLAGQTVLRQVISRFSHHQDINRIQVVIHPDDRQIYDRAIIGLDLPPPVHGGETRQQSVLLGLRALASLAPRYVLVHDGARPSVSSALVSRVLAALEMSSAALPGNAVADTLKRCVAGQVLETVDRDSLFGAQTPQGFHFPDLLRAHEAAMDQGFEATDDAMIMEWAGHAVALVAGDPDNFKITTMEDLQRMEKLMTAHSQIRVGSGFDAHRLTEGDQVILCGIPIPGDYALLGHSDADVALHAITDALLGALAEEDIGHHFPPKDETWRGQQSDIFVGFARDRVYARGGQILHVDLTIICETPRISGHRQAMRARLAEILDISVTRISVKATTTEGMGFTGRREGIAAQATATLSIPG